MSIPGVSIPDLQKYYPSTDKKALDVVTDVFGAKHWLASDPNLNTCAIRLSRAFNYAGAKIKPMAGVHTETGLDKLIYIYRASEFVAYCTKQFGKPDVVKSGKNDAELTKAIKGKPGVLFFRLKKETSSGKVIKKSLYGHADVWDGAVIWYNDVLWETWEVTLWSV